jgi:hypothetical protein
MSYSNPSSVTYAFSGVSFASSDTTFALTAPTGFEHGTVRQVLASVTTTCAGATTTPFVQLGKAGTLTKYANVALGTTAAGAAVNGTIGTAYVDDTALVVTMKAATGAGAAGVATVFITIEWF